MTALPPVMAARPLQPGNSRRFEAVAQVSGVSRCERLTRMVERWVCAGPDAHASQGLQAP